MRAFVKQLKSCAFALLTLSSVIMAQAGHAKRAYTVDDMLRLEQIGKVRFDLSGEHLIFELYGPYDQQSDYSRTFVRGEMRSRIYIADLTKKTVPRLLFNQKQTDSYIINGISPDGNYVGYDHSSERGFSEGIVSLASRQAHDFSFSPDYSFYSDYLVDEQWIPGHRLVYTALKSGEQPFKFALFSQRIDLLVSKWHQARAGKVPTASAIGSGIYADFPGYGEHLVLANANDGSSRILGQGKYLFKFASPDGKLLAALRADRLVPDPSKPLEHGNFGAIMRTLVIYNLTGDGRAIEPCKGCDVLALAANSLDWSTSGRYLAFVARESGQTWKHPTFWVFDRQSERAERQAIDGLTPHRGRHGLLLAVRVAWLGDRLAVLLDRPGAAKKAAVERDVRADWYLLGGNSPVNLTKSFPGKTPDLIATSALGLILTDGKDAWLVDASGHKRNLSGSIAEPVIKWQKASRYGVLPHYDMQPIKTLVLQTKVTGEHQAKRLYFIDVASGAVSHVAFPSVTAEAVDASPVTDRAAFLDHASNATVLSVAGTRGKPRRILEINGFLRDVVGGTPVAIDHRGPKGDARRSWMLLPPGHKRGDKLPTVVNVYPGLSSCHKTFKRWRLDQVHELNDHILAAHGYAVLYPCIPVDYEKVPREPAKHIVQQVYAAVDAAVAQGYADPDRLAIQGQSYGAYTTGLLVGLTHRFKSAVAQSGIYDLISFYGEFDQRGRLDVARKGLSMFGARLSETSHVGMGASPWDAPERYLRNSPLMHVKAITTPILLINGDLDYVNTTQSEEFFTALTRLHKNAEYVRYFGEGHVFNSPANIRDMWHRIFDWYAKTLGPPVKVDPNYRESHSRGRPDSALPAE